MKQTSGRCKPCKKYYSWSNNQLLKNTKCPLCKRQLTQTTYLCKDKKVDLLFLLVSLGY
jgi:transcription initiation factor IIE alpha subunit